MPLTGFGLTVSGSLGVNPDIRNFRRTGEVYTKKIGSVYTEVYTMYYTLPLVGVCIRVYTSPGRWGAHYTIKPRTTPPGKKLAVFSIMYTSPVRLVRVHNNWTFVFILSIYLQYRYLY